MKFLNFKYFFLLLFIYFSGYVKSETLEWKNLDYPFTNENGWTPSKIPTVEDDTIIGPLAINVSESVNNITVNSITADRSGLLLSNQYTKSKTISISGAYFNYGSFLFSDKIDLNNAKISPPNDNSQINSFTVGTILEISFYGISEFLSTYGPCTIDTCKYAFIFNTIFTFNDKSSSNIQGIEIFTLANYTFNDESFIKVDETSIYIDGVVTFNDKSNALFTNISENQRFLIGIIILNQQSNLTLVNNPLISIHSIEMYDDSYIISKNSVLDFSSSITMNGKSKITLDSSLLFSSRGIPSYVRNIQILNSSDLTSSGDFYCEGDYLDIQNNSFISSYVGDLHLNSTITTLSGFGTARTLDGNIHIYKKLEGNEARLTINGGNLIVYPNSNISLVQSDIYIKGGKLFISEESTFILETTNVRNENGTLSTSGLVYISPGSSILNQNQFIIQSSIISTNKSSNIPFKNIGTINLNSNNSSRSINKSNLKYDINDDDDDNEINEIRLEVNLDNSGSIKIEKNQNIFINKYTQSDERSSLVIDNSTISSNQTILFNQGTIYGNGTFNNSLTQDAGEFGSRNQTISIDINGDYTLNSNGTILIIINSIQDFSKINILNNANINGNIEIRLSRDLLYQKENQQLNIINYSNLNSNTNTDSSSNSNLIFNSILNSNVNTDSNGFKSIKFKTYDPVTGKEEDRNESSCLKSNTSKTSFSVLVGGCSESSSSLSGGAIAGIVVGCAVAVILVGTLIHYRSRLSLKFKQTKIGTKLSTL